MDTKEAIKTQINEDTKNLEKVLSAFGITMKPADPWEGVDIPTRYDLRQNGVFRIDPPIEDGGEPVDVFICSPAWVRSYSIDGGGHWYANVEFIDRMDVVRAITVPASRLFGQAKAVASELVGKGHYVGYDKASSLAKYLLAFRSPPADVEHRKSEAEQIIEDIKEFILKNEDRFQSGESFAVRNRAGYRYRDTDWWAFTSSALREASGCHSAVKVARVLKSAGLLVVNDASNMMKCPTSSGARPRMYVIAGHILECDTPTLSAHVPHPPPIGESKTWAAETRATSGLAHVAQVAHVGGESSQHGRDFATELLPNVIDDTELIVFGYNKEVVSESDMSVSMLEKAEADEVIERVDEWCEFLDKKGYKMSRVIDLRRRSESDPMSVRSLLVSVGFF